MRQPRLKVPPESGPAIYHCISRVVGGERLLDDPAKEVLRRQMWELADFCGLDLLTYTLLSNHFHLLALVPQTTELTDAELVRRYRLRHPPANRRQIRFLDGLVTMLEQNGPAAQQWRQQQRAMMGDLSQYMKLLKQGFTTWYNDRHERFGTLWAERFQSELVEASRAGVVAAYLDLNSVRAGLARDPKDYRFCGYAEAVAGNPRAQRGLAYVLGLSDWPEVQAAYRLRLFGTAALPREGAASISAPQLQEAVAAGGRLPLPEVLRCRIRYLSRGVVLGSLDWVQQQLAAHRARMGQKGSAHPWQLPAVTDWGDLAIGHRLRGPGFG
jgi:hypothetical protein